MKYLLTLSALACLYSMLYSPSQVIERHNKNYMRKLNSARPLVGKPIQQVDSILMESDARLGTRNRIASYHMALEEQALQSNNFHNNIITITNQN